MKASMGLWCLVILLGIIIQGTTAYTVQGNKIIDPNGKTVLLRGICRPSLEWDKNGEGISLSDYTKMKYWGANIIRISLNQDWWLADTNYQNTIKNQVTMVRSLDMGVMFDLHWNNGQQQQMADQNSIIFWYQMGQTFKNNPWIVFELYNEPYDVSWSQWLYGDSHFAGMQELYDSVRSSGAQNMVVVGGLNWAFDLSGIGRGFAVIGTNIAYASHPYDYSGKQRADWDAAFGNFAATYPVILTEFGQYCATNNYVQTLLDYADQKGIHWTAWAWYPGGCGFPAIITSYAGFPTVVGDIVLTKLGGNTSFPGDTTPVTPATSPLVVYNDAINNIFTSWSWATDLSFSDTTYYIGSKSIKMGMKGNGGVYFHLQSASSNFVLGSYGYLQLSARGSTTISKSVLYIILYGDDNGELSKVNFPVDIPAGVWTSLKLPISDLRVPRTTKISGVAIQGNVESSSNFIWLDEISFLPPDAASTTSATATTSTTKLPTTTTTASTTSTTKAPTTSSTSTSTSTTTAKSTTTSTTTAKSTTTSATSASATTSASSTTGTTGSSGACGANNVVITQTSEGTWQQNSFTISSYKVSITNTCTSKALVGLTLSASSWDPINFWGPTASTGPNFSATLVFPSYIRLQAGVSHNDFGYQNKQGQATFTVTSVRFE